VGPIAFGRQSGVCGIPGLRIETGGTRQFGLGLSRNSLLATFAALFAGVLLANGLNDLALISLRKDLYVCFESTVATTASAIILVFLRSETMKAAVDLDLPSKA